MIRYLLFYTALLLSSMSLAQSYFEGDSIHMGRTSYNVQSDGYVKYVRNPEPTSNSTYTMFNYMEGLWLGGIDSLNQLHLSANLYSDRTNYYPGPISTDYNANLHYDRTYTVTKGMVDSTRRKLYVFAPDAIANWPAHGRSQYNESQQLAPFVDVNGNGVYEWQLGDYPAMEGDIMTLALFNDKHLRDFPSGKPLEIEGYALYYMYDQPGIAERTLFRKIVITNKSDMDYSDVYMGFFSDFEANHPWSNLVYTDIQRQGLFSYQLNGSGFPIFIHRSCYSGAVLIEGPSAPLHDQIDNNWDGCVDGEIDANGICQPESNSSGIRESMALSKTMYMHKLGTNFQAHLDYYQLLRGRFVDGTPLRAETPSNPRQWYDSDGYDSTGTYPIVDYCFPGTTYAPLPNWSPSQNVNWFHDPNFYMDTRMVYSMGPTDFKIGQTLSTTTAIFWGDIDTSFHSNLVDSALAAMDSIHNLHARNTISVSEELSPQYDIDLRRGNNVLLVNNSTSKTLKFELLDLNGRLMETRTIEADQELSWNIESLTSGIYVIRTSDGNWSRKWIK